MAPSTSPPPDGYLALVLHAHLPFVRHPEHAAFLEEEWLFEAITETYLPLLRAFEAMARDGVPYRITLSLSPPLLAMLRDPLLQRRYEEHLERLLGLAAREVARTRGEPATARLARHYLQLFRYAREDWRRLRGDLVSALAALERRGHLALLTCAATHGYLPLLRPNPAAVRAQIRVAVEHHRRQVGRLPSGIWLPECGYYPGLDEELADAGLRFFIVDTHALLLGRPRPVCGSYAPVLCPQSGAAAFARDVASSVQVWSRERGYPGDPVYREFYRDIGFDLPAEAVRPFVLPDGGRKNTGIKYHRITGPTDDKELYDPEAAAVRATEHALDFLQHRRAQLDPLDLPGGAPPLVVAPYDAELFGHWWFEGPLWLESVLRLAASGHHGVEPVHLPLYLERHPTHQLCQPAQSSWGQGGFHGFWLNESNDWLYPHLHRAADQMSALARDYPEAGGLRRRALDQAARELLLAQASDWAFIMRTGTTVAYAEQRSRTHLQRFARLERQLRQNRLDPTWLAQVEHLDAIFPELNYRVYA